MKKYDLNKFERSKIHFELKHAEPYFMRNLEKASKPHRHSFYQLIWFKNKGKHYVDFEVIDHPENTVFLINTNQVHYFCPESNNQGFLFHFNDIFVSKYGQEILDRFSISIFNEMNNSHVVLSKNMASNMEKLTQFILYEMEAEDQNYAELIFHYFFTILLQLERIKNTESNLSYIIKSDLSILIKFKQLVRKHLNNPLNLDQYAQILHVSTRKLNTIIRKMLDCTPGQVIRDIKILEAKRMLTNEKVSIKEVAFKLGFNEATYFTKFFKQVAGSTPKEFQKALH